VERDDHGERRQGLASQPNASAGRSSPASVIASGYKNAARPPDSFALKTIGRPIAATFAVVVGCGKIGETAKRSETTGHAIKASPTLTPCNGPNVGRGRQGPRSKNAKWTERSRSWRRCASRQSARRGPALSERVARDGVCGAAPEEGFRRETVRRQVPDVIWKNRRLIFVGTAGKHPARDRRALLRAPCNRFWSALPSRHTSRPL